MDLYVCNATTRPFEMHYRLPAKEGRDPLKIYMNPIPAGGQIKLENEKADTDHIVKQLTTYGARTSDEASRDKSFSGIIYSTARPINHEAIMSGLDTVDQLAIDRAQAHRTTNAIAADDAIARAAQERGEKVSGLEVDVQEQPRPGVSARDLKSQKIKVEREGARTPSRRN